MLANPFPGPSSGPFSDYTGLNRSLLEAQPEAAWQRWLGGFPGGSDFISPFFRYAKPQYGDYLTDYYQTASMDKNKLSLSWLDYLTNLGNNPYSAWQGLSPGQRGEQPGRLSRPAQYRFPGG